MWRQIHEHDDKYHNYSWGDLHTNHTQSVIRLEVFGFEWRFRVLHAASRLFDAAILSDRPDSGMHAFAGLHFFFTTVDGIRDVRRAIEKSIFVKTNFGSTHRPSTCLSRKTQ